MAAAKLCTSMYHRIPGDEVGTIELPVFQAFTGGREPKLVPISLGAVHEYPSRAALSRVGEMK
jgi:hypothetical protein